MEDRGAGAVIGQPGTWRLVRSRRQFLLASASALLSGCSSSRVMGDRRRSLDEIEATVGGRAGVFALDTGNGRHITHRPDQRFAMCSTFKWVLAAVVLARVDRSKLSLDEHISYGPDALLDYAPATRAHVAEGSMTVGALAKAAVTVSDNTAANLLLAKLGGPPAFTEFVRVLGDSVTRLDRNEPALNSNAPGDPRDTTSPRAMVGLMRKILCEDALSPHGRELLLSWLRASETGKDRLRAGLPQAWVVGDKTGSGERGAVNDVAIAVPPGRAPILIASYLRDGTAGSTISAAAHAEIGKLVARVLRP